LNIRFNDLLDRADDETLQELVSSPVVRLLRLLDPQLAAPKQLRALVRETHHPAELLRDAHARRMLTDGLPRQDAERLCRALNVDSGEPYSSLREYAARRGSPAERTLFRVLGVSEPENEQEFSSEDCSAADVAYPLFAHQRRAVRECSDILSAATKKRVLLHMPTGSGKTRTAMHLVSTMLRHREPRLVVWLAYSEELCAQAAEEFASAWRNLGDREVSVYRFWGPHSQAIDDLHDGLVVASLPKMYQRARREANFLLKLADRSALVVIDEAHQAVAATYRFVLNVLVERSGESRLLGLTATPGRTWNNPDADAELAAFFNRQKVTLSVPGYHNPVDYLVDEGYLARPIFEDLTYAGGRSLTDQDLQDVADSLDVPDRVLTKLAEDEQRNLLIVTKVEQLLHRHLRIIVFAANIHHARLLAAVLKARGTNAASVTGDTPRDERRRLITAFKARTSEPMVLCNYGVLTTGFDAPNTSAAVIARPTKSLVLYSQMVGRATRGRRAGGNEEATIVTIVDTSLPGFGRLSEAFTNWEDVW
jgi:DNA repair protein RadD